MFDQISIFIENLVRSLLLNNLILAAGLIFLIIFCETGLVITPFLPGDSLLFILGALISSSKIYALVLFFIVLSLAAILGNTLNYSIGKSIGNTILSRGWIKREHLIRTENFYKRHGAKTIIFSRFVPIIRTIAPFVAGIGKMNYRKFLVYNIIGGVSWVSLFLFGGYFFGSIPLVKDNLSVVMLIIIVASLIPTIAHLLSSKS